MKILLIDDHPLFRKGIAQALADLMIAVEILEAGSAREAFEQLECEPDIDFIFLDLELPDMDGLHFMDNLKQQHIPIPVVILSAQEAAVIVDRCLSAGASGYLSKSAAGEEIADTLQAMQNSGHYVAKALRQSLDNFRAGLSTAQQHRAKLTRRQQQVLQHLAKGMSNQHIAEALNITESTVKGHVSTLFTLINVDNRIQCVSAARAQQLIK